MLGYPQWDLLKHCICWLVKQIELIINFIGNKDIMINDWKNNHIISNRHHWIRSMGCFETLWIIADPTPTTWAFIDYWRDLISK